MPSFQRFPLMRLCGTLLVSCAAVQTSPIFLVQLFKPHPFFPCSCSNLTHFSCAAVQPSPIFPVQLFKPHPLGLHRFDRSLSLSSPHRLWLARTVVHGSVSLSQTDNTVLLEPGPDVVCFYMSPPAFESIANIAHGKL